MMGHYHYLYVASHYWNQFRLAFSDWITTVLNTQLPIKFQYKEEKKVGREGQGREEEGGAGGKGGRGEGEK